jgi:hypothetical protein
MLDIFSLLSSFFHGRFCLPLSSAARTAAARLGFSASFLRQ